MCYVYPTAYDWDIKEPEFLQAGCTWFSYLQYHVNSNSYGEEGSMFIGVQNSAISMKGDPEEIVFN